MDPGPRWPPCSQRDPQCPRQYKRWNSGHQIGRRVPAFIYMAAVKMYSPWWVYGGTTMGRFTKSSWQTLRHRDWVMKLLLWNLAGASAAGLPRRMSKCTAIGSFRTHIKELRNIPEILQYSVLRDTETVATLQRGEPVTIMASAPMIITQLWWNKLPSPDFRFVVVVTQRPALAKQYMGCLPGALLCGFAATEVKWWFSKISEKVTPAFLCEKH